MSTFPHVDLDLEKLTAQMGLHLKNTLCATVPQGLRTSCKACLFNIFSGDLYFDILIM